MKIEIQANDFCPDNCPHFEPQKTMVDKYNLVPWRCKNTGWCKFIAGAIAKSEMCRFTNNQAKDDQE